MQPTPRHSDEGRIALVRDGSCPISEWIGYMKHAPERLGRNQVEDFWRYVFGEPNKKPQFSRDPNHVDIIEFDNLPDSRVVRLVRWPGGQTLDCALHRSKFCLIQLVKRQ